MQCFTVTSFLYKLINVFLNSQKSTSCHLQKLHLWFWHLTSIWYYMYTERWPDDTLCSCSVLNSNKLYFIVQSPQTIGIVHVGCPYFIWHVSNYNSRIPWGDYNFDCMNWIMFYFQWEQRNGAAPSDDVFDNPSQQLLAGFIITLETRTCIYLFIYYEHLLRGKTLWWVQFHLSTCNRRGKHRINYW